MIRYADDLVVLCRRRGAEQSMPVLRRFLAHLKLTVNEEKTRVVSAQEGFDFLGVHFRKQPTRRDRRRSACYAWPSQRSMKRIRDKVRRIIHRDERPSLAETVEQLNPVVRGWGNYFSRLNSSRHFWKVDSYVFYKLRRWLRRKHQRVGRAFWSTPPTFFVKAGPHVLHEGALETELRRRLNGHEAGNGGYRQGEAYGPPRQRPTLQFRPREGSMPER